MIITKTPLRISFAGGGTDLPAFYESNGYGAVVSTTIDKYVYIALHPFFENKFLLKYSKSEMVDTPQEVQHPLIREALLASNTSTPLEITSFADIPAKGSGLGSSSAFCVGLLHALSVHNGAYISTKQLASMACTIEMERLGEPIGKQDQHATAIGGLNYLRFNDDGSVFIQRIVLPPDMLATLERNLLMFYTGITRDTKSVLAEQRERTTADAATRSVLLRMRGLADELRDALQRRDLSRFGEILNEGWQLKRKVAGTITNDVIDEWYDRAIGAGALGGRLLGAGGGGFLLFYVPQENHAAVREALRDLREVPFSFDMQGTRIAHIDN
jgi:D-glycero-alpha-D-manno-heptose-7-phosphate kinase